MPAQEALHLQMSVEGHLLDGHSLPFMALQGFSNRSIGTFHNPHCVELSLSFLFDSKCDILSHY